MGFDANMRGQNSAFPVAVVLIAAFLGPGGPALPGETSGVSMSSGAAPAPTGGEKVKNPAAAKHRLVTHRQGTADAPCEFESKLRSRDASISTYVNFVNRSNDVIRTYWLNYQGERVFYSQIDPGNSYRQQTYVSHPWIITDSNNHCLSIYFPQANESSKVVY
jgi:hypothetical protein